MINGKLQEKCNIKRNMLQEHDLSSESEVKL